MKKSDQKLTIFYFVFDILLLNISITLMLALKYGLFNMRSDYRIFYLLYNVIWICVVLFNNTYRTHWREDYKSRLFVNIRGFIIYTGSISVALVAINEPVFSRIVVYGSILFFIVLKIFGGFIIFKVVGILRYKGKNTRKVLILGAGRMGRKVYEIINNNRDLGFKIIGFLDDKCGRD